MATHQRSLTDQYTELTHARVAEKRVLVITADWNKEITENLSRGCVETLAYNGLKPANVQEIHVPGAVELVYAAAKHLDPKRYDAIVVIGCVIRGETAHFDYVCK